MRAMLTTAGAPFIMISHLIRYESASMKKYNRVFVPNPSRLDEKPLYKLADQVIYACDSHMYESVMGEEHTDKFEDKIVERLTDFNPNTDVIAAYGDIVIFMMMGLHLSDRFETFDVAKFSQREQAYITRRLSCDNLS